MYSSGCPWADCPQGTMSPQEVWVSLTPHRPSPTVHSTACYREPPPIPKYHLSEAEKCTLTGVTHTAPGALEEMAAWLLPMPIRLMTDQGREVSMETPEG